MARDDPMRDRQTQSGALADRFCRKERVEGALGDLFRHAYPIVAAGHADIVAAGYAKTPRLLLVERSVLDRQRDPAAAARAYGLYRVRQQIECGFLKLCPVTKDLAARSA